MSQRSRFALWRDFAQDANDTMLDGLDLAPRIAASRADEDHNDGIYILVIARHALISRDKTRMLIRIEGLIYRLLSLAQQCALIERPQKDADIIGRRHH